MYTSDLMNYESLPLSWLLKKLTTASFVSDFCLLKSSTVVHILPSKALQDYVVCVRSPSKPLNLMIQKFCIIKTHLFVSPQTDKAHYSEQFIPPKDSNCTC